MPFKPLQVVRTTTPLQNSKGHKVPVGTRLVVVHVKDGTVTARGDKRPSPDEQAYRIVGPIEAFTPSARGRPATKKAKKVEISAPEALAPETPTT